MAITANQYKEMRRHLFRTNKVLLKQLANLPDEGQLTAAFQVLEDLWENNKATVKGDIDTALGVTTTTQLAKAISLAFLVMKVGEGG